MQVRRRVDRDLRVLDPGHRQRGDARPRERDVDPLERAHRRERDHRDDHDGEGEAGEAGDAAATLPLGREQRQRQPREGALGVQRGERGRDALVVAGGRDAVGQLLLRESALDGRRSEHRARAPQGRGGAPEALAPAPRDDRRHDEPEEHDDAPAVTRARRVPTRAAWMAPISAVARNAIASWKRCERTGPQSSSRTLGGDLLDAHAERGRRRARPTLARLLVLVHSGHSFPT